MPVGLLAFAAAPQADLAVAQTVVAKGEHARSNGDLGDVAAAVFGDPLEGGP